MPANTSQIASPPTTPTARARIDALDVVRGFALCGILVVNIPPIASIGGPVTTGLSGSSEDWLGLLTVHRFFPIFSLLFGIGFALQMRSAAGRVPRPRLVLARRLLVLLGIGVLHFLVWPGDILTTYAVVGLAVLLPATWLPRWAGAGLAAALIATSLVLGGDRLVLVAGLFLLGAALVRYGVVDRIERSTRVPLVLGLVLTAVAAPLVWAQVDADLGDVLFGRVVNAAGLLLAGVYICAVLVLLRTPLRTVLHTAFAPLGRMALTNYLTATLLVGAIGLAIGGSPHDWPAAQVLLIAAAVLIVQWLWSTLWLRRFRFGPVEWLWRWATWARRPALRRS
ncbi:DUF418 domain-containing protein [Glycomyces dulcitolivorans]|uniref:DUF418 domain-containing protein n=1 Tax=Glycomyces dulcitolivorans TaxID=2200759 RepID=UPI000DD41F27|nr:DUF418 domain-containing protein [Glycomyces dulcitolivorans]